LPQFYLTLISNIHALALTRLDDQQLSANGRHLNAELHTHYRSAETLERLAHAAGFREVSSATMI